MFKKDLNRGDNGSGSGSGRKKIYFRYMMSPVGIGKNKDGGIAKVQLKYNELLGNDKYSNVNEEEVRRLLE